MDSADFGLWAMFIFWGSAIGGVVWGISWAKSRKGNPVDKKLLVKLLQQRLEKGEIDAEEFADKMAQVQSNDDDKG